MAAVWTHGTWTVKPGREDEFVASWRRLAEDGTTELDVPEPPTLLRDRERPNVFVSFGPWPDDAAVERFRSSAAFREGVAAMEDLLERFEPRTLDEVWRG
jgi:quinol monooxygenase YgiN